jgi:hypothetical protein
VSDTTDADAYSIACFLKLPGQRPFMNLKIVFYIVVFLVTLKQAQAQAPRFIFLDSLSDNLSPVSPIVIKSQGYIRTESYSIQKKTKDTTMYMCFYYNQDGLTTITKRKLPEKDTMTFLFRYDDKGRVINTRIFIKNRLISTEVADYSLDTIVERTKFNWKGNITEKRVLHFNDRYQLLKHEVLDSLDKLYEVTIYTYDDNGFPIRATQRRSNRQTFDNAYEYANKGNEKTVKVYEMFGGYKRLIEKIEYNSKRQLEKTISYNYTYGNKIFTANLDYYDDGSLQTYEGEYHYSGFKFKQVYLHRKD